MKKESIQELANIIIQDLIQSGLDPDEMIKVIQLAKFKYLSKKIECLKSKLYPYLSVKNKAFENGMYMSGIYYKNCQKWFECKNWKPEDDCDRLQVTIDALEGFFKKYPTKEYFESC